MQPHVVHAHFIPMQAKVDTLRSACDEYRRECEEHSRKEGAQTEAAKREADRLQVSFAQFFSLCWAV